MSQMFFEPGKGVDKKSVGSGNRCPVGFFLYIVRAGDTISALARRLGVDEGLIIANIPVDPARIRPGMALCLPVPVFFPCCAVLRPVGAAPATAAGAALIRQTGNGRQEVSFLAAGLPNPATLGNFNAYEGFVEIAGIGGFAQLLSPIPAESGVWAGTVELIRPVLFAGAQLEVRPVNTATGLSGEPVLRGDLLACARKVTGLIR